MKILHLTPRLNNILLNLKCKAELSPHKLYKHSSVILNKKNTISEYCYNYSYFHAEYNCLNILDNYINNNNNKNKIKTCSFSILVIRINKQNELMMSKPCKHCWEEIKKRKIIKFILYSDENGNIIKENINTFNTDHCSKYNKYFD